MLTVQQISKTYGITPILHNISFIINDRERLALIGPNGCGKSTLLKILAGQINADSVRCTSPGRMRGRPIFRKILPFNPMKRSVHSLKIRGT